MILSKKQNEQSCSTEVAIFAHCLFLRSLMPPTSWSACAEVLTWWRRRGRTILSCTHIPHIQHSISPLPHSFTPLFVRRDSVATVSPKYGNGKGFQTYIYIYKFVVSFLKIHQLGGSNTLWGVEVAKKHISQLMVADFSNTVKPTFVWATDAIDETLNSNLNPRNSNRRPKSKTT